MLARNITLNSGERQVAPTLAGVRRDHVARYQWAVGQLAGCRSVLDVGCGIGYGTHVLAEAGKRVVGIDISDESIAYARQHYAHANATYDICDVDSMPRYREDAAVCFEVIEHLQHPATMLADLNVTTLLASVPNQNVYPYEGQRFHHRHYTRAEFEDLLYLSRWRVVSWFGQPDTEGDVEPDLDGWTLVARCIRDGGP